MQKRRTILQWLGGSAGTFCVARFGPACSPTAAPTPPTVVAGSVRDYGLDDLKPISSTSMAVGRDELGLYALSTRCTHDDCDMLRNGSVGPSGLRCSCHNSNFDRFGHRLTGPAQRDLPHYRVALDPQGTVLVFTNEPVDPSTRVKPVE